MIELAAYRLNLLRAAYLLIVVGLGLTLWPAILDPASVWEPGRGIVIAMLAAFSLLALIGLRHPLRMLPLLFWELTWKALWLVRVALPAWLGDRLDPATTQTAIECLLVILIVPVIPWDHVLRAYVQAPGERWRRSGSR